MKDLFGKVVAYVIIYIAAAWLMVKDLWLYGELRDTA